MEQKIFWRLLHAAGTWGAAALVCGPLHAPVWHGMVLALVLAAASSATAASVAAWCAVCATGSVLSGATDAFGTICFAGIVLLSAVQFLRGSLVHPGLVWVCVSGSGTWVRPALHAVAATLLVSLTIRDVSIVSTILLASLCLIAAYALPRSADRIGRRMAEALGLLVAATLISLLLAEYASRMLLEPRPARQIHERHPEYLFTLRPNTVAEQRIRLAQNKNKIVGIRISSQGFRDREYGPKAPDEFRVLLLGDSFAMGFAVEEQDGFARQLETLLAREHLPKRVSVVNGGMTGAGPWQEWGILRDRGLALQPDLVILQLCTVNDIDNSLEYVGKRQRSYYRNWHVLLEMLRSMDRPAVRAEYTAQRYSRLYREIWFQTGLHHWVLHSVNALRWMPRFTYPEVPASENRLNDIESDLNEWYPDLYQGLALLESFVVQMRDLCEAHEIRFAAFSIPPHAIIDDMAWHMQTKGFTPRMYDRGKGLRVFDEILRRNEIPTFSVVEALKSHPRIDEVYYVWDGHLTELGNGLVAQAMRDFVMATCFPSLR